MSDPQNPNIKSRNTPQWALYQRDMFWKDNTGEVPPFSTDPGDLEDLAKESLTKGGWYSITLPVTQANLTLISRTDRHFTATESSLECSSIRTIAIQRRKSLATRSAHQSDLHLSASIKYTIHWPSYLLLRLQKN
ncbi:hypothetical protein BCIN_03g03280 [Botrytis cinerea B05.10]|uniref:Uncharacterized protein n=1 Tax=Botryotinia fuckeliana (strain B05.10) TaxID=332648 RepID=A0A384JCN0_BOTFB|nr:hypothetical protein BCIN_03g03280 [Botrytis cinerea B05.10]ATZ48074.1 hypothetical protein BCIN_03g03280 [Botrytis cinerea B05.10]